MSEDIASRIVHKYSLLASFDARISQVQARSIDGSREKIDQLWAELSFGRTRTDLQPSLALDFDLLKAQATQDCGLGLNQADYLLLKEGGLLDLPDCVDRRLAKWAAAEARSRASPAESPKFRDSACTPRPDWVGEQCAREPAPQPDLARLLQVQKKLNFAGLADSKPEQPLTHTSNDSEEERLYAQLRPGAVTFGKEALLADLATAKPDIAKSTPPMLAKLRDPAGEQTTAFKSDLQSDRETPKSYLRVVRQPDSVPPALQQASFVRKNPRDPKSSWFESNQFLRPEQVQEFELDEDTHARTEAQPQSQAVVSNSQVLAKASEVPAMGSFERLDIRDLKPNSPARPDPTEEPAGSRPPSAQTLALLFDGLLLTDRPAPENESSCSARSCQQFSPLVVEQRLSRTDYPAARGAAFDEDSLQVLTDRISLPVSTKDLVSQSSKHSDGLDCLLPTSTERKRADLICQHSTPPAPTEALDGTRIFPSQTFPTTAVQPQLPTIFENQFASDLSTHSKHGKPAEVPAEGRKPAAVEQPPRRESQHVCGGEQLAGLFDSKSEWCFSKSPRQPRCSLASELKAARIHSEVNSGLKSNASPARFLVQTPPNAALLQSDVVGAPEAALKESLLLTMSQQKFGVEIPCTAGGHLHYSSLTQPKRNAPEQPGLACAKRECREPLLADSPVPAGPSLEPASNPRLLVIEAAFENRLDAKLAEERPSASSESSRPPIRVTRSSIKLDSEAGPQARPKPTLSEFDPALASN